MGSTISKVSELFILTTFCVLIFLMQYRSAYNLKLESIAVNGQKLPIDSSLFATPKSQGTVLDSGTALTYLVHGAYGPFISAVSS
jgi:hypothetical protein